jgi:heme-degrading monooxygenase HmoA
MLKKGKGDEAIDVYRKSILADAQEQEGFKGATLLTDKAKGRLISITVWATEADMRASESSGYLGEQLARIGPALTGETSIEHYEVSFHA